MLVFFFLVFLSFFFKSENFASFSPITAFLFTIKHILNRDMKMKSCADKFLDVTIRFLKKDSFISFKQESK